jgi:1-deoxy-D-xylulose-5-phosphate reductoisomerase
VIGATGSVGSSVLDICARFPERFEVVSLAAGSNAAKLTELGCRFNSRKLCLAEPKEAFCVKDFECLSGVEALSQIAADPDVDQVVFASSGTSAIKALQTALKADKDVSLANKESIVVAGPWVMPLVKRKDQLRPIDSEHSAVWQCLRDAPRGEVAKIWLTASGGPFRDYNAAQMKAVTPAQALAHPVWKMGPKVTIDSATLMNKGIECIEAMQLFGLPSEKVGALIHPRSQVHGMALFCDGTMKMLLSQADMRLPSAAAIAWPERLELMDSGLDFVWPEKWELNFKEIDKELFPCFEIAREAGRKGGAYPSLLIGADEAAVNAFLSGRIGFLSISGVVEETLSKWRGAQPSALDDAIALVDEGRRLAEEVAAKL